LSRGAAVVERPTFGVRIAGPDARRFANNMFTNNVRDLPVGGANRHALTDDRGRVQGFLDLLCEAEDQFLAFVDGPTLEAFIERYDKYIVFDDVEMTPVEGLTGRLLVGPGATDAARTAGLPVPASDSSIAGDWGVAWWQALGPIKRAGLAFALRDGSHFEAIDVAPPSDRHFTLLRVLAGHPVFPVDTDDKTLPHELGLRDVVLAFDKGCYLGQESINRIDVMGQVKRHLRAVRVRGLAKADAEVLHAGRVVGRLTSPVRVGEHTFGLAILRQAAAEADTAVRVGGCDASVLTVPVHPDAMGAE